MSGKRKDIFNLLIHSNEREKKSFKLKWEMKSDMNNKK